MPVEVVNGQLKYTPGAATGRPKYTYTPKAKLDSLEGLEALLRKAGYEKEADKVVEEPKMSFLQRLGSGLQAFEIGNALYKTKYESRNFFKTYASDVVTGIREAVSGKQIREKPKKTFSDILSRAGMKQREGKLDMADILGFGGDVLLDPSTYLGGWALKAAGKGVKAVSKVGAKGLGRVSPQASQGLGLIGEGIKDSMGRAFVFGYGTSKGLSSDILATIGNIKGVKAGIIKKNVEIFGKFSKTQKEELVNSLMTAKRSELELGKGAVKATFKDPEVQKVYDEILKPRRQKFSELAEIQEPFENYFPSIKRETTKSFMENASKFKVGSEGYKKQFKNILKDDELIKDPTEAFAKNEYEIVKNVLIRKDLQKYIKVYGRPFKSTDEARKAGYELVKEKGQFGKELGYLKTQDKKFIDNLISPEFAAIDQLARATGFDYITGLFKRSVTGLFAPFHVRNYVSGNIQNFETLGAQALDPRNIADGMKAATKMGTGNFKGTVNIGNKVKSARAVWQPFRKRFVDASQYISDFDQTIFDINTFNIPKKMQKMNPLSTENYAFKMARTVGNFIETQQKAVAYMTALRQGKTMNQALDLAEKAGFDYRALTPFESKVMKRLIPFYAFTRKNLELQTRTLGSNPERIALFTKMFRETFQPTTDENVKPEWMNEQFMFNWGKTKKGEKQVIAGFGTPIEEFAAKFSGNPLLKFLSMGNPLLKVPLERATGKDFFRQRDLKDVYNAKEYGQAPQIIKDLLDIKEVEKPIYVDGEPTGETKTTYVADPEKLHLARGLFTSRMVSYLDTLFAEEDLTGTARAVKSTTGIKPYVIDEETVKYFEDKDRRDKLESILKRLNIIKTGSYVYLPKI